MINIDKIVEAYTEAVKDKTGYDMSSEKVDSMNQYQALLSFAYNIGSIDQLTDYGRRSIGEIEKAMPKYVKANGVILEGLVKRRNEELKLFRKEVKYD